MKRGAENLYLDLMKKTLAFTLWPEPPTPLEVRNGERSALKRLPISCLSRILRSKGLQLVKQNKDSIDPREEGNMWSRYAGTMISLKRLDNLQFCVETAIREGIKGDFIETGVWRGGACILMRAILAALDVTDRKIYVADSFEGLPMPDPERYPADQGDTHHTHTLYAISKEEVENNFKKFGLLDEHVIFLEGWFKNTLPNAPVEHLAVMRLDGDMYSSTMDALTSLYPKLSKGGFCIIDDYGLDGCRKAVDDFRAENSVTTEMQVVDWTGRYWRKQ